MNIKKYLLSALFVLSLASAPIAITGCCGLDSGVAKYDTLVSKNEDCNAAWADIDASLQRRSDLIPNLVEVVKASAKNEKDTLTAVMEARASATQVKLSANDLENPEKMKAFQEAQDKLNGSLSRLMMVQESYPELRSNQGFKDLLVSIEGTENRILRAREVYNKHVRSFNIELNRVSGKAINPLTGNEFKQKVYFTASESAKEAPKVNFSTPTVSSAK